MKSVLISIQPKWVNKIASGEKTIEVRKTRPKLETPFKCYIYETTAKYKTRLLGLNCTCQGKGKVIGEFVCDKIVEHESEFWDDETYESIGYIDYDEEYGEREKYIFAENGEENTLCKHSCLTWNELREYIGQDIKTFYGWHISDLKIYDKPKELSEFYSAKCDMPCENKKRGFNMDFCMAYENGGHFCKELNCDKKRLTRPPQSWCYVESGVQCE